MKKTALLLSAVMLLLSCNRSLFSDTVVVSSFPEFVKAIRSDRTILMQPGTYVVEPIGAFQSENATIEQVQVLNREQYQLAVRNVSGLNIASVDGTRSIHLYNPGAYAQVMAISDSAGISISDMVLGHFPDPGFCIGSVVRVENSDRIEISNSRLFGSGVYGVVSRGSSVYLYETLIDGCTLGAIVASDDSYLLARDTVITNNSGPYLSGLVRAGANTLVELSHSHIFDNSGPSDSSVFRISDTARVLVVHSTVSRDGLDRLSDGNGELRLINTKSDARDDD